MKPITLRSISIMLSSSARAGILGLGMAASMASTSASILDLGDHPSDYLFQASVVPPGTFEDIFTFSVPAGFDLLGSVVASIDSAPTFEVADGRYFVVFAGNDGALGTGDDNLLSPPAGFDFSGSTGAAFNATPSVSGLYGLVVRGSATGTSGGRYSFTSFVGPASPVPEPKAVALALSGLPLIGWLAYRRTRSLLC